jgi:ArsR family transcriptional regulator
MATVAITEADLTELQAWLKVLADPKRFQIINLLIQGIQCNCELGDRLNMPRNLISHHLGILREAGLVELERDEQDARWIYYSLNPAALNRLHALFDAVLDPARIQPRQLYCGPQGAVIDLLNLEFINSR